MLTNCAGILKKRLTKIENGVNVIIVLGVHLMRKQSNAGRESAYTEASLTSWRSLKKDSSTRFCFCKKGGRENEVLQKINWRKCIFITRVW